MIGLLLLLTLSQTPVPKVEIPQVIKGDPNNFITVLPTTNGKVVKYVYLDKGLNVFPSALLANPIATVVTAPKGKYRLLAYTAIGDAPSEPAICIINVGDVPDAAPFGPYVPSPDPKPTPDEPDDNKPKPPVVDPLEIALKSIWGGLSSADKQAAAKAAKLSAVYREGYRAALDKSIDSVTNTPIYNTVGDIYKKVNTLGKAALAADDIVEVRDRLRTEMNAVLPRDATAALDDALRSKIANEFKRYADILEKLK